MSPLEHMPHAAVVVGVDGSAEALAAVDLAAAEAARRRRPLHIVHAFRWPYLDMPLGSSKIYQPGGRLRRETDRFLAEAAERARAAAPATPVDTEFIIGEPAPVLAEASRSAALIVLGDRGLGRFAGLILGSVAGHLAAHAACPVLVAHGSTDPAAPVLLGADGSPANDAAVGFAFEAAALRAAPLTAVHAWTYPVSGGDGEATAAQETRVLAEGLAGWHDQYPDVTVHRELVRGDTRSSLLDAAGHAQLAVVGTRGRGGFAGLLLGSVSRAVLHHAACPVAVVPHHHGHPPG